MRKCLDSKHSQKSIFIRKIWGSERWIFYKKGAPVVVKIIDVKKPLSVQVHPSGERGKDELWYILKAGKGAKVLGGIDLKEYKIKSGDWIYLPGGTVHTIYPPAVLLEVSQGNLVTYRLYDWGRGTRPLNVGEGIRCLDVNAKPKIYRNIDLFRCPYFQVRFSRDERGKGVKVLPLEKGVYVLTYAGTFSVNWTTNISKRCVSGIL